MLPNPDKAYDTEPIIYSIWMQFKAALRQARRGFVRGHSSNDSALVGCLQRNVSPPERLAVSLLADPETESGLANTAAPTFDCRRVSYHLPASSQSYSVRTA